MSAKRPFLKKSVNTNDSSGGFLSVDREQALKQNWSEILSMKRPANTPSAKKEKLAESTKPLDRSKVQKHK